MIEPTRMTLAQFDNYVATAPEGFIYELRADGILFAFATGTEEHGKLCTRLGNWISARDKPPCQTYIGSMAVRKNALQPPTVIPDVVTTCEPSVRGRNYILAPSLVVEVMSPKSVTNDLLTKPHTYDAIRSIDEYLVVESRSMWARLFRRDDSGILIPFGSDLTEPEDEIELRTVELSFSLGDLCQGIL